jgi:hypothetical protein
MRWIGPFQSTLLIALAVGAAANAADTPTTAPALPADVPEGSYIQGTDPAVYFVRDGQKHLVEGGRKWMHMQSPTPFRLLQITDEELNQIPTGAEMTVKFPDGSYIKGLGPAVYLVQAGQKHWVPDVATIQGMQHVDSAIFASIDNRQLNNVPTGFDIPCLTVDPTKQFQVFADQCAPDSVTFARVTELVAALKGGDFRSRSRAEKELDALGKTGILALMHLDRHKIDAEQSARIDKLLAPYQPIPSADAGKLRSDPSFLVGCLFSEEPAIRIAALSQLQSTVKPKLNFDPTADLTSRTIAIVPLLQQLIDAEVIPAKTTPQVPGEPGDVLVPTD